MKKNRSAIRIPMPLRYVINLILIVAVWFVLNSLIQSGVITNYWSGILITVGINIILATSLNVATGYLGQLPLGHAGFMAVGAYAGGIFMKAMPVQELLKSGNTGAAIPYILLALLISAIVAGIFGIIIGIPALRLRGDYLAIVTLGFGLIVENVIANLPFAGGDGLASGTASSSLYANGLGLSTSLQAKYVWLVLGITVLCIALMCTFIRSKYGRAIEAIRDDEIAAAASGVNTTYYKILTFVISAFFAGLAGGLYATCFSSLTTASFTFTSASIWNSTFIVVIVVLGGMGSMTGSVLAAVAMYLLNYEIKNGAWVSALPGFVQSLFQFPMLIYALVLLVVIIFRPRGILGTYEFSLDRLLFDGRLAGKKKAKARKGGADA